MNNLSWFLYFAEVLPRFSFAVQVICFLFVLVFGFCLFVAYVSDEDEHDRKTNNEARNKIKRVCPWFFFPAIIIWTLMWTVPSKETIYLIAGSEATEAVATSQTGQEILGDVKEVIRSQLEQLKKEK